jgi:hypothetical protein
MTSSSQNFGNINKAILSINSLAECLHTAFEKLDDREVIIVEEGDFLKLLKEDSRLAQRQYWRELISKVIISSFVHISRTSMMADACIEAINSKNIYSLSNNMRALLESSGNGVFSLMAIGKTLQRERQIVQLVFSDDWEAKNFVASEQLENAVNHYLFALKDGAIKSQSAKKYIDSLKSPIAGYDLYSWLCMISHPRQSSTAFWDCPNDEGRMWYRKTCYENNFVSWLPYLLPPLSELLEKGLNVALLNIAAVNHLGIDEFRCTQFSENDYGHIKGYKQER